MNTARLLSSCFELNKKYNLYHDIIDIFPEDAKSILESYELETAALKQLYGIENVNYHLQEGVLETPLLIRQQAYSGNSLESLISYYINYKNQGNKFLKSDNIEPLITCVKYMKKYKNSIIFKYGKEKFLEALKKELYNNSLESETSIFDMYNNALSSTSIIESIPYVENNINNESSSESNLEPKS